MPFAEAHLIPHYPEQSPLEAILQKAAPGTDEYITELYASELTELLAQFGNLLKTFPESVTSLVPWLHSKIETSSLVPSEPRIVRSGGGVEVRKRQFSAEVVSGQESFLAALQTYLAPLTRIETAELQVTAIAEIPGPDLAVEAEIRYALVGDINANSFSVGREQRSGVWDTQWSRDASKGWQLRRLQASSETVSQTRGPVFRDITEQALGQTESYRKQMLRGVDYWRTVLDGACGIDVYGNNGVAVGDIAGDGHDSLYVCQPSGLPNRLYRNHGDGTFEDVTEAAGVGVLDATACALFADFENKGVQDLLVVCASGPLLFMNQGNGKFVLKKDAFRFSKPPQGAFTHAAIADYDRDGFLDIYFCLYSYYVGLDQYHYPVPYFDARNGPPNLLLHNEGNATFTDRTEAAGLNVDNDRYSFSCAWGDQNADGWPDLYVANDFGRSNLYRNNGNGTFTAVSTIARVEDTGAGMSATWLDFDNDGKQDIYVSNMWSASGLRVAAQKNFHEGEPEAVLANYRRHARGNSLYRNLGDGTFRNVADETGAELGGWAWSSDAWDFDHDGYPDIYTANGYLSGPDKREVSSFFWRQVVGKSPQNGIPSLNYEQGWNAINELIRADTSWAGPERNVFFANNRNGTFTEIAGVLGLDFPDDSRAFALADLDHDGRLEVVLKNRNAPQLRVLHNDMAEIGHSISFRLRGTKSNRDAIGAAVTVETGSLRQTKYLQAGSGFLSQHSKELFFGLGGNADSVRASVRWPSGATEVFEQLPVNHRIELTEGASVSSSTPFQHAAAIRPAPSVPALEALPTSVETWLIQPLPAPDFALPSLSGETVELRGFRGNPVLLTFWAATGLPSGIEQLQKHQLLHSTLAATGLRILAIHVDEATDLAAIRQLVAKEALSYPVLQATPEIAGVYNIVYRYLFDRRRDMALPTAFLVDQAGMIVKVYQGVATPAQLKLDLASMPTSLASRIEKALPFPGTHHQGTFQRNDFTYGVAFFQRGYLEQATNAFQQVIANKPDDPAAHYNLGTLYLRRNNLAEAQRYLEKTVTLRPDYPEAWNNLGMISAQQGLPEQAIGNFRESIRLKPDYGTALLNLGNLYRRQHAFAEAETLLQRALEVQGNDAEPNYSLGMLYAQQDQPDRAVQYLQRAIQLRPDYPDALNNLGVFFVRQQRYAEAEATFTKCVRVAPQFDQAYLNLARLYVLLGEKDKATQALTSLLVLQPGHKIAQQALELLH